MTQTNFSITDQNNSPLVSIIMNCYNGERYLKEAINSVLVQTYQNWEIIFWDNQSTDRSGKIFENYTDPRLKYFYAPKHTRLYEARNYAIEKAKGDFFAFLDVDDWWISSKLEKQISLFLDSEVGIVCGNFWVVSEVKNKQWKYFKRPLPSGWVLDDLLKWYFVGLVTLVISRKAFESLDYPFDKYYHISGDSDLVIRLSRHWKLCSVQEPIAFYRKHINSESVNQRNRVAKELDYLWHTIRKYDDIRLSPQFHCVKSHNTYIKAIYQVLRGDKKAALILFKEMTWCKLKFRLLLALILPISVVKKLKN